MAEILLPEGITGKERGFYIVNDKHKERVMEVERANPKPGAEVSTSKKKDTREPYQLWYIDHRGFLRSKLNHFAIEASGEKERCHMQPFTGDARQQWKIVGNRIINETFCNECLDIKGGLRGSDDIVAKQYDGKEQQHWHLEFIDD